MFSSLRSNKSKGFTIFELLVSVFIISLLSSVVLVSYRSGQRRYTLSQEAQKLISSLRKAQNMAMSGTDISENEYYGYGIYIEEGGSSYLLYADKNGDVSYESSDDDIVEQITLAANVSIQSVLPVAVGGLDIFYESPDPHTFINGGAAESGSVVMQMEGLTLTQTVIVNDAGLIE